MHNPGRAIILTRYISSKEDFLFSDPIESILLTCKQKGDHLFVLDNYSDPISISFGRKLTEECEEIVIIADLAKAKKLETLSTFYNSLIKRSVKLILIDDAPVLTPFLKLWKGRVINRKDVSEDIPQIISN